MEESQKELMKLLVSSTLRKHGIKKENVNLTDQEKAQLKKTILHLQEQYKKLSEEHTSITETDVNPATNVYDSTK